MNCPEKTSAEVRRRGLRPEAEVSGGGVRGLKEERVRELF